MSIKARLEELEKQVKESTGRLTTKERKAIVEEVKAQVLAEMKTEAENKQTNAQ